MPPVIDPAIEDEGVEARHGRISEHGKLEFSRAIVPLEIDAEGVLRILGWIALGPALNLEAALSLGAVRAVRKYQFHGTLPFPSGAAALRMRIDAQVGIEEVR